MLKKNQTKRNKNRETKNNCKELNKEDIKSRNLPNQTSGLVITKMRNDSPLAKSIELNSIILEAQKKKIRNPNDLSQAVNQVLKQIKKLCY